MKKVLLLALTLTANNICLAQTRDDILKKLDEERKILPSLTVKYKFRNNLIDSNRVSEGEKILITDSSNKFISALKASPNTDGVLSTIVVFDGGHTYNLNGFTLDKSNHRVIAKPNVAHTVTEENGLIKSTPNPLEFSHVIDGKWVSDYIRENNLAIDPVSSSSASPVFKFQGKNKFGHLVSLDILKDKLAISELRQDIKESGISLVQKNKNLQDLNGIFLTKEATREAVNTFGKIESEYVLSDIEYTSDNQKNDYDIVYPKSTVFTSYAERKVYRIGNNGEKMLMYLLGQQQEKKSFAGIVFVASTASLLLLGMGYYIKWRQSA